MHNYYYYILTTPIFYCSQSVWVSDSRPPFESWARFLISRGESDTENVKPGRVLHSNFKNYIK